MCVHALVDAQMGRSTCRRHGLDGTLSHHLELQNHSMANVKFAFSRIPDPVRVEMLGKDTKRSILEDGIVRKQHLK